MPYRQKNVAHSHLTEMLLGIAGWNKEWDMEPNKDKMINLLC